MWTKELFGTDVYHLIAAFIVYSILGWFVESVYMSFCNRKLTNRGFAKGPFCPIYGFGAVIGYLVLSPFRGQYLKMYFLGAFLATVFEFLTGVAMIHILGSLWWDYHEKPFNYKGIICMESTIAWGFYGLIIVHLLHGIVYKIIDGVEISMGIRLILLILGIVIIDYIIQLLQLFHVDMKEKMTNLLQLVMK